MSGLNGLIARVAWLEQRLAAAPADEQPRPPTASQTPARVAAGAPPRQFRQVLAESLRGAPARNSAVQPQPAPAARIAVPVGAPAPVASAQPTTETGGADVMEKARALVGRPYRWGAGRSDADAFDCSGFAAWVYRQTGRTLPAHTDAAFAATAPADPPAPGDLVFYRYDDPAQPGVRYPHMGIYAGDGKMIDAALDGGVQVRPLRPDPIFRRLPAATPSGPPAAVGARLGLRAVEATARPANGVESAPPLAQSIGRAAALHGVASGLVTALVRAESGFDPRAVSAKGAKGLMQLMDGTARQLGVTDPMDPEQNLAGGVRYLRWLLDRYDGDTRLALAAYNAGPGAVDRHGGVPPYAETQRYVEKVLAYTQEAQGAAPAGEPEHGREDR